MFYVHVIGPWDNTFVGPFGTQQEARTYAAHTAQSGSFDTYVMTRAQFMANVNEFGLIPVQAVLS